MNISPCAKSVSNSVKTCYLIFSAMSVSEGRFELFNSLKVLNGEVIFLNDSSNNWYQEGVPGIGSNLEETINYFKSYILNNEVEKVVCVGASMGAYGAALYAIKLNADIAICMAGEYQIGIPFSRSTLHSKSINKDICDLVKLSEKLEPNTKFHFFSGTSDVIDLFGASLFESYNNAHIYLFKNQGHSLTKYLNDNFSIRTIIQEITQTGHWSTESSVSNEQSKLLFKSARVLLEGYIFLRRKKYEEFSKTIDKIKESKNLEISNYLLGMYFLRVEEAKKAKLHLSVAYEENAYNKDILFEYAIATRKVDGYDKAIEKYKELIQLDNNYAPAYYHLGICYNRIGLFCKASINFRRAMSLSEDKKYLAEYVKNIKEASCFFNKLFSEFDSCKTLPGDEL